MNIIEAKNLAVRKLFDETCLRKDARERLVSAALEIFLIELEKGFDETENKEWSSNEIRDCFYFFRKELIPNKREIL